jgi:hypothetical protein
MRRKILAWRGMYEAEEIEERSLVGQRQPSVGMTT